MQEAADENPACHQPQRRCRQEHDLMSCRAFFDIEPQWESRLQLPAVSYGTEQLRRGVTPHIQVPAAADECRLSAADDPMRRGQAHPDVR